MTLSSAKTQVQEPFITPQLFGAKGDGTTDDTIAFATAFTKGSVYVPSGTYLITDTIHGADLIRSIHGAGPQSRILFRPATARPFISMTRSGGETALLDVTSLYLETEMAACGTAFKIEEIRDGASVVGGVDFLRLSNVTLEATGSGYWTRVVHAVNAGGVMGVNVTARNNNNLIAQNDTSTRAFWFENNRADIAVIRALQLSNFYTQRFYCHIYTDVQGSIEACYLDVGEMVGGLRGIFNAGPGAFSALGIGSVHMDMIQNGIRSNGAMNIVRLTGTDIRTQANGAAATSGVAITINNGNYWTVTGCTFTGYNNVVPANNYTAIQVTSDLPYSTFVGNTFRYFDTGFLAPNVSNVTALANSFQSVATPYKIAQGSRNRVETVQAVLSGDVSGSLADLMGSIRGSFVHRVITGVSDLPSGVTGQGHMVETLVWDNNAAFQRLHATNGTPYAYVRRKVAGAVSAWVSLEQT